MNSQSVATPFVRGVPNSRDPSAPRRAYLDTYAKRRGGTVAAAQPAVHSIQEEEVPTAATQSQPLAQQQSVSEVTDDYIQPQPASTSFVYTPVESAPATVEPVVQQPSSHKTYLDTLVRRHQHAVAAAPVAEETVVHSSLSSETEALLDDPEKEARLEANLRALYTPSLTDQLAKSSTSASAAHVRTIVASALTFGILSFGVFSLVSNYTSQPVVAQPIGAPVIEVASSNTDTPRGTPVASNATGYVATDAAHPVRIVISSIGVNAPVEGLGTTPEGLIAVPKSYGVVGWYNKGSIPGKPGPAILVGHYTGGNKGVFDNLQNLKDGDLVTTTNGKGESFTYRITAKKEYDKDKVPMAELFKKSNDSRLEIITCSGKWQANNYNKRLVITAELVR